MLPAGACLPVLALLAASTPPDYAGTAQSLEEAFKKAPLPETLLALGALYEAWPGHCQDAVGAYRRFFTACGGCVALTHGVDRFDALVQKCNLDVDTEIALRESFQVKPGLRASRRPADATRPEVAGLLRDARTIDPKQVGQIYITLVEAGPSAPRELLNELRQAVWALLIKSPADAGQVQKYLERMRAVDPELSKTLLDRHALAARDGDQAELDSIRLAIIQRLGQDAATTKLGPELDQLSC